MNDTVDMNAETNSPQTSPTTRSLPDPSKFKSGDFIWPKQPGSWVPYNVRIDPRASAAWHIDKDRFIDQVETRGEAAPDFQKEAAQQLKGQTYEGFAREYFETANSPTDSPMGAGARLYTGHVAIVLESNLNPLIVEAIWGEIRKVRTIRYDEWLQGRPTEQVWHGRWATATDDQRKAAAEFAATYVGRPYDFWNFNLADDRDFYCSKLVWFAYWKITGRAIDGNNNPHRIAWVSPKQLMNSDGMLMLNKPGNYTGGLLPA